MQSVTKKPQSVVSVPLAGFIPWQNPENAKESDDAKAKSVTGPYSTACTEALLATVFGFNLPTSATVLGVKFELEKLGLGNGFTSMVKDKSIRISKSGVTVGEEKADGQTWDNNFTYIDFNAAYGSPGDLWGLPLTPNYVNAPDFGIAVVAELISSYSGLGSIGFIDSIQSTVYYTV